MSLWLGLYFLTHFSVLSLSHLFFMRLEEVGRKAWHRGLTVLPLTMLPYSVLTDSQAHLHLHFLNEEAKHQNAKEVAGSYKPVSLFPCPSLGCFLYTVLAQHEG